VRAGRLARGQVPGKTCGLYQIGYNRESTSSLGRPAPPNKSPSRTCNSRRLDRGREACTFSRSGGRRRWDRRARGEGVPREWVATGLRNATLGRWFPRMRSSSRRRNERRPVGHRGAGWLWPGFQYQAGWGPKSLDRGRVGRRDNGRGRLLPLPVRRGPFLSGASPCEQRRSEQKCHHSPQPHGSPPNTPPDKICLFSPPIMPEFGFEKTATPRKSL
jgi:hypothetical protein